MLKNFTSCQYDDTNILDSNTESVKNYYNRMQPLAARSLRRHDRETQSGCVFGIVPERIRSDLVVQVLVREE